MASEGLDDLGRGRQVLPPMPIAVYQNFTDEDLAAGRHIVGTGTLEGDGRVGRIGSIREKAFTAVDEGADVMLVPASQADDARRAAGRRLEVVGVETIEDALRALRRGG